MRIPKYIVKRRGHTEEWSEHRTRNAAERECAFANRAVAPGHEVIEEESAPWYAVVSFGSPTSHTIRALGNPARIGSRVTRDLDAAIRRADALRPHVSDVRILACPSREAARRADISETWPIAWHR